MESAATPAKRATTIAAAIPQRRQLMRGRRRRRSFCLRRFLARLNIFIWLNPHARATRLEHLPDELFEIDTERERRHRHETVISHAGNRIDLEQQRPTGFVHHEIRAPPAARADGAERGCLLYTSPSPRD